MLQKWKLCLWWVHGLLHSPIFLQSNIFSYFEPGDKTVCLLVGANCVKALEPNRIIPSQDEGSYAFWTTLDWCIDGPVEKRLNYNNTSFMP